MTAGQSDSGSGTSPEFKTTSGRRELLQRRTHIVTTISAGLTALTVVTSASSSPALAQRIENQVAVFAALDKVTARISKLEVKLGESTKFGALKITPKVCYSRPPTEPPKTSTFVEVVEAQLDGKELPLFAGWMFAESPGLNAVEHPVYDIWLTGCAAPKAVAQPRPPAAAAAAGKGAPASARSGAGEASPTDVPAEGEGDVRRRRPPR